LQIFSRIQVFIIFRSKSHEHIPTEDEDLRKDFMEMREMMKLLMEERNTRLQGEGSNPSKHKGDSGDKTPNGNGGNGASPPPSPPPSSSSSTSSIPLPNSPKGHGKTPSQIPLLKLDIKFELPMYNGEVNAEKLDNWIHHIEVYCRIQKIQDDETKIQLAYNQVKDSLTQASPFEACFGYLPKSPLDFIFGKDIAIDGQYDIDRAETFIEQI
jgi:hypothetical protein